jgi:hypothetical protein
MAVIKLSGLVNRISGKLQGSVFTFGQAGQIVKSNSYSQPQFSPRQTAQRMRGTHIPTLWQSLTLAQKNAWDALTPSYPYTNKAGVISQYSAYGLFLLINQNLQFANLPLQLTANGKLGGKNAGTIIVDVIDSTTLEIQSNSTSINYLVFFGTRGLPSDRSPRNSDFLQFAALNILNGLINTDLFTEYTGANGPIVSGLRYWFYYKNISPTTGQIFQISDNFFGDAL